VSDAEDPDGGMFGLERFEAALASAPGDAGELLAHIPRELETFTRGATPADDVTLVALVAEDGR